jgi:hypothetical protein
MARAAGYTKCPKCGRPIAGGGRCPACASEQRAKPVADFSGRPASAGRGTWTVRLLLGALVLVLAYAVGQVSRWRPAAPPVVPTAVPTRAESTKLGLGEEKRREIFREILLAEDWAQVEADRRHPALDPSASSEAWERHGQVREQFRKQASLESAKAIAKRYGVTLDDLRAIASEGVAAAWPRPPRQSLR